jgi:hypothetical protein
MNQKTLAIVLIVLGALALAYQGFTYTSNQEVINLGPIQATVSEKKTIPLPPILGGLAVAAGAVMLYRSRSQA